jgi:hypothetical protein
MAADANRVEELECLVAESLAELQALRDRERGCELGILTRLFAVDLRPLGLVARGEKGSSRRRHGPHNTLGTMKS